MTLLIYDKLFANHDTGNHPESTKRITGIATTVDHLLKSSPNLKKTNTKVATEDDIRRVHQSDVLEKVNILVKTGGGHIDPDTVCSSDSLQTALTAAGSVITAVDQVVAQTAKNAVTLIRPPGHHATRSKSMGFCLFNNVAVAAQYALTNAGIEKVLIIDWDVHHGNGTQDIFYDSDQVFFLSLHRFPFYPGTGKREETGTGKGKGFTLNIPIEYGITPTQYVSMFEAALNDSIAKLKPDLIFISAGFDAHKDDPIGDLGLESTTYGVLTQLVHDVANKYCDGRVISCLEGGYNIQALAESIACHVQAMVGDGAL